jgi:amidase
MGNNWEVVVDAPWSERAAAKRRAILEHVPLEWRLSEELIEAARSQREVTVDYMKRFLDPDEVAILSLDTVPIVDAIKQQKYTAKQVTRAFCKAAAIAHQIVWLLLFYDTTFNG